MKQDIIILGIESSCDDTSAAILRNDIELSNVIAGQKIHEMYGGVVPELASRAHQQNIVPVIDAAIKMAGINKNDISAVAFTNGPGLLGSLLVGASFAKGFAASLNIPLIEVNHLQGHVLSSFLKKDNNTRVPEFPFLCMLVSGGHTEIVVVKDYFEMQSIGKTIDDAAGEAFDKCAKTIGLPYPGGPHVDRLSKEGDANKFSFSKPNIPGFDFSFSGLKTSFLYFLRDAIKEDAGFIENNKAHLCASLQKTIIEILMSKLVKASIETGIKTVSISGGVAANSGLRNVIANEAEKRSWTTFVPELKYTTDNAAMIAVTGYYKYLKSEFSKLDISPSARAGQFK